MNYISEIYTRYRNVRRFMYAYLYDGYINIYTYRLRIYQKNKIVYRTFHVKSTRLILSLFFFSFKYVIESTWRRPLIRLLVATKNDSHQFLDFFLNFPVTNHRNCRFGTEDCYRFFLNLHHKFFD